MKKPELLAPAGNLEKLRIACTFGADAVYVGTPVFGLRKYADNFSIEELQEGIAFAHSLNKKVYIVLNGYAHNSDIAQLSVALPQLADCHPDAFIISDMGVLQLAKQLTPIPIHVSTQASVTNWMTCKYWIDAGATRIILAREVSISDCEEIKKHLNTELEIFIHGAMCAAYSGKCVISNYTSGRDSNRGGCIQSCRHTYKLSDPETPKINPIETHIMNAKDLMGIRHLPNIIKAGIESVKIEGRMKSNLYVANACMTYRKAIDWVTEQLTNNTPISDSSFTEFETQLSTVSNRQFSSGGLNHRPAGESIHYEFNGYTKTTEFIGTILENRENEAIAEIKFPFHRHEQLHILIPNKKPVTTTINQMNTLQNTVIDSAKQNSIIKLSFPFPVPKHSILTKPIHQS